jgi:hypothetical protein
MKIYNAEEIQKNRIGMVRRARIYNGTAKQNLVTPGFELLKNVSHVIKGPWKDSKEREEIIRIRRNREERIRQTNAATGYDAATIQALAGIYTIDIVGLADDLTDITPILFAEKFDESAPEMVNLLDYLHYIGKEENMNGSSDTVPLMQHVLPEKYPLTLYVRGFGDKTTLRELVFNPFHKTENIIESAARILADEKNADSLTPIFKASYTGAFAQAADATGTTFDVKLYNTIRSGIMKALKLYNYPTKRLNGELRYKVYLLISPVDLINIQPVVNGALASAGGLQQIASALPIDGVIPYSGGLNHGQPYGKETLNYPGVAMGEAYAFIRIESYGGYRIVKRNETMEVGEGDILGLTTEKRAWHRIRGVSNEWVLPKTEDSKNYGAIVKITLPTS